MCVVHLFSTCVLCMYRVFAHTQQQKNSKHSYTCTIRVYRESVSVSRSNSNSSAIERFGAVLRGENKNAMRKRYYSHYCLQHHYAVYVTRVISIDLLFY